VATIRSNERELFRGSTGRPVRVVKMQPVSCQSLLAAALLFSLSLALRQERGSGQWHQWQCPYAGLGLDRSADELPADAYECGSDIEVPAVEVHVLPTQRRDFAAAHAVDHCECEERMGGGARLAARGRAVPPRPTAAAHDLAQPSDVLCSSG
jgi:hypothetical protein